MTCPHEAEARCSQCWLYRPIESFFTTKRGRAERVKRCALCRAKYRDWATKTPAEKRAATPPKPVTGTGYKVSFSLRSNNRKTGPIPVSMTDRASCPTSCALHENGCYAEQHWTRVHWDNVAKTGMSWKMFCEEIALLPPGTLWRHNEAGDLPGKGDELDFQALAALVLANRGRRGFSFTHKNSLASDWRAIDSANRNGFTINLSADSLVEADYLASLRVGPVAVTVEHDAPLRLKTPAGRRVVICPAQTEAHLTCLTCQLCAMPKRKAIVGFRAHGTHRYLVSELVREKR